jgi:hypothetical protein
VQLYTVVLKAVFIVSSNLRFSRSRWPRFLRRGSAAVRLLRLWVWIPPVAWMSVSCECCVLSGRDLCFGLISRPEEFYRMWCVVVCDLETSWMRRTWPTGGCGGPPPPIRSGLPSDSLPSRFTTKVVVNVYLSSLPSYFTSNSSTDLQFWVKLCSEAQNSNKVQQYVM